MQRISPELCWENEHKYSLEVVTYRWAFRIAQESIPNMYTYIETELHRQQQRDPSKPIILWVHLYIEQRTIINLDMLKQICINTNKATGEK